MTHYLELGHALYALCGAAIMKTEHSLDPDCPACRATLDALNAETAEERFGMAAPRRPSQCYVRATDFDTFFNGGRSPIGGPRAGR